MAEAEKPKDITSQWIEGQQNLLKMWLDMTSQSMEQAMSFWQSPAIMTSLGDWYQKWLKSFPEAFPVPESTKGLGATVLERLSSAAKVYQDLLRFWADTMMGLAQLQPGTTLSAEKTKELYDQWVKNYQIMMSSLWGVVPSTDVQETVKALESATGTTAEYYWRQIEPVLKNLEQLPETLSKMAKGESGAMVELTGIFWKNYEATLGQSLRAPTFGFFRGFTALMNKTIDAYIRFNTAVAEFYALFYNTGLHAGEKVFQRLSEFQGKELTPETFHEFYRTWWTTNEDVYHDLFLSPQFINLQGEVVRRGLLFRKWLDDLSDEVLKFTNLPTKKDMDEVYHSIYELKNEVRWQRRTIHDLENHLKSSSGGAKTTRRTSKRASPKEGQI